MKMRESIIVVSNDTYDSLRENAMETASLQADPINYIAQWNELNFVIDDTVPYGISEVWYKDIYEFNKELERIKKEMGDEKNG